MRPHSVAYQRLRKDAQDIIDFAVLICHGMPALNAYMKAVEKGAAPNLPTPDHFGKTQPFDALRAYKQKYKKTLGRFVVLSSISYFEMYVKNLAEEIVQLHRQDLADLERRISEPAVATYRNKLSEPPDGRKIEKYKKHVRTLRENNYPLPTDLFATCAINRISSEAENLMLGEVPNFLRTVLFFPMSDEQKNKLVDLRKLRNRIAHGTPEEVDLSEALECNKFLRRLAVQIDRHAMERYLIIDDNVIIKLTKRNKTGDGTTTT